MKNILLLTIMAILASCGNSTQSTEKVEKIEEEQVEITKHGAEITEDGVVSSTKFLTQIEGKDSLEIKLTANILGVCPKKGCWMKLDMQNGKTMRVRFKDYDFFVPKDATGKIAIVQGMAKMDTTDVATLKHYAEDANATQEEIDAITEPEINYFFEATGVIIKEIATL